MAAPPRRDPEPAPLPPSPLPPPPPAPGKQREEKKTALSKVRGAAARRGAARLQAGPGGDGAGGGDKSRGGVGSRINLHFLLHMQVVIRRLPPCLTKEQLEEQLHPLPAHDYFEFCTADPSLYPHLYSRAYINFRNPEDILLFRDRFDGYVFIDNKGLEYPAVVEFAPFQKISKKKLKKKDAKAGSIEDDPEYRKFLESYCADEEKICANPETLLGEIEAKTRELIGLFS
uniref:UPF3 domain-containing protein n=1 Tax=Anas platyrhynchos TaxID=8839 RepID=A0A8B9QVD3_ANAPL